MARVVRAGMHGMRATSMAGIRKVAAHATGLSVSRLGTLYGGATRGVGLAAGYQTHPDTALQGAKWRV